MKGKEFLRRSLACLLIAAMMPQQTIAFAAEQATTARSKKEDVLVRWIPSKNVIEPGEKGTVKLEARINKKNVEYAEVSIHLDPSEVYALCDEKLEDDSRISIDWLDDGGADLYFDLDEDTPRLSRKIYFQMPTDTIFDIDVTPDDIEVVASGENEDSDEDEASPSDANKATSSEAKEETSRDTETAESEENSDTTEESTAATVSGNVASPSDLNTKISDEQNNSSVSETKDKENENVINAATPSETEKVENAATPSDADKNIDYEDDVAATESEIGDSKHVKISTENGFVIKRETQALRVEGVRPEWKMDVKSKSGSDADEADTLDFSLTASPKNRKSAKSLADKEQTLTLTIKVPDWLTIQSGEVTWDQEDEQLLIDGTTIAKLEGVPEEFVLTDAEVTDEQTITATFERVQGEEELLTLLDNEENEEAEGPAVVSIDSDDAYAVSLVSDYGELAVNQAENTNDSDLSYVEQDDDSDDVDITPVSELSNLKLTFSLYKSAPLFSISDDIDLTYVDETTNGDVSLAAVLMTTSAGLEDNVSADATAQIELADYVETTEETIIVNNTTDLTEYIYWIDNGNASNNRPVNANYLTACKPKIYFTIDNFDRKYELNETNWKTYFYPESSEDNPPMPDSSYTGSSLYLQNLPTKTTVTKSDDTSEIHEYKWTIELSNFSESSDTTKYSSKYSLIHVTDDNRGEYSSASSGCGWYYVERDELKFHIDIEAGNKNVDANKLLNVIKNRFVLHTEYEGGSDDKCLGEIQGKQTPTYNSTTKEYDFNIKGVWKYNLDGTLLTYSLQENTTKTGKISNEELNGAICDIGKNDYLLISYNNTAVPNFGSVITELHNKGIIDLLLKGDTSYNATKIWADNADSSRRPTGTLELWRYREGESYKDAAPVRNSAGIIVSKKIGDINSNTNQENISFDTDGSTLEKYDPEGYKYIYVTREYLDSKTQNGTDANSYEQIYGAIKTDSSANKEYIQDKVEDASIERDYQTGRGDESSTCKDDTTAPAAYVSGNDWLYNGGTLTNHLKDQIVVEGVKHWETKAFQDDLKDVTVTMTLYSRKANDTDTNWTPVSSVKPIELNGFQNETVENDTFSASVPQYDSEGNKLVYRWIETSVTQNKNGEAVDTNFNLNTESATNFLSMFLRTSGKITDDAQKANFSLSHIGENTLVQYESTSTYDSSSGVSTIINNIVDKVSFTLQKKWAEGMIPYDVSFSLYRTIGDGNATKLGSIKLVQTENSKTVSSWMPESVDTGISLSKSDESWQAILENLPKFDSSGRQYQYYVTEVSNGNHPNVTPTYETKRNADGNWETTVTNATGTGKNIWVRKDWLDDGDSSHREPVTIGIYEKSNSTDGGNDTRIKKVKLSAENSWYAQVDVGDKDINNLYIVEEMVGSTNILESNSINIVTEDDVKDLSYTTDHHVYEVNYLTPEDSDNSKVFVVQNRRVGTIDYTVTKEWKDGDGSSRIALKNAVTKYNTENPENKIDLKIRLKFASDYSSSVDQPYTITEYTTSQDTVKINQDEASQIYKSKTDGVYSELGYSSYSLLDTIQTDTESDTCNTTSSGKAKFCFFNLPKYDYTGANVAYTIEEVWVDSSGSKITDLSKYTVNVDGQDVNISALWSEYSMSLDDASYTVGNNYTGDQQKVTMTNRLSGTKNILWHKQWQDNYNYQAGQRPDIYLTIYRGRSNNLTDVSEYTTLYRWLTPENGEGTGEEMDKLHHWHAVVSGVPKYDNDGYELTYFALENTKVDKNSFDYQTAEYSLVSYNNEETGTTGNSANTGTVIGTEDEVKNDVYSNCVRNVGSTGTPRYALSEGGTITNRIENKVPIRGQKLWKNLPSNFWDANNASDSLPNVKISVMRNLSDSDDTSEVATLEIKNTDWKYLGSNGSYAFELKNMGDWEYKIDASTNNATLTRVSNADSLGEDESTETPLPRYDENGKLYEYTLQEEMSWSETCRPDGSADTPDFVYQNKVNAYILTNTYNSYKGAVRVKKLLELPAGTTEFPAIAMKLTRLYEIQNTDGNWSKEIDRSFAMTKVWSADSVRSAFQAKDKTDTTIASYTLDSTSEATDPFLFENLDVYAPNGSKYTYYVQEVKESYLQGYDTWAVNSNSNDVERSDVNKSLANSKIEVDLTPNQNNRCKTAKTVEIEATYLNAIPDRTEKITLKGEKQWTHYSFQTLPSTTEFASWLTLYRSTDSQPSVNNAINEEQIENVNFYVTTETVDSSTSTDSATGLQTTIYKYTIIAKSTDTSSGNPEELQLEKYATNGMPWKYVVKETIPDNWSAYFQTGSNKNSTSVSASDPVDGVVAMNKLTNTALTEASYSKKWVDDSGKVITADYTGLGTLKVDFELQVKEGVDGSWTSAEKYFTDAKNLTGGANYNNLSIEGNLLSTVWKTSKSINKLPKFVNSMTEASESNMKIYTPLYYRVVEKSVSIKDGEDTWKNIVSWNVTDMSDKDGYTLTTAEAAAGSDGSTSTDQATSMITPYYGKDTTYHSNNNNDHINQLHLQSLTITKEWKNDRNNLWESRPKATTSGNDWSTWFVVQRREKSDDSTEQAQWEIVKQSNKDGSEKGPYIVTISGNNGTDTGSATVTGLLQTAPSGKAYEYRFVELPSSTAYTDSLTVSTTGDGETVISTAPDGYSVKIGKGTGSDTRTFTATNTLETREVKAAKSWVNNDAGNNITLQLTYKGTDGRYHAVRNSTVALDGTADSNPASASDASSNTAFGYEDNAWHAKWTLPKKLPSAMWSDNVGPSDGDTEYAVVELNNEGTNNTGYRQVSDSSVDSTTGETTITNMKLVKLKLSKIWRANNDAKKEVQFDIYRIAGASLIPENDNNSENLGTVTLNSTKNWSWSGYYLDSSAATSTGSARTYFDKYTTGENPQKYLYYAREISVGGSDDWSAGKISTNDGKRYEVETQTLAFTDTTSGAASPSCFSGDERTATFTNFQLRDINVYKYWNDNGNAYNTRPDNLIVRLYRTTSTVTTDGSRNITSSNKWVQVSEDVELSSSNVMPKVSHVWNYTWHDLPYYDEVGNLYTYKVEEVVPQVNTNASSEYSHTESAVYVCNNVTGNATNTAAELIDNTGDQAGIANLDNTLTKQVTVSGIKYWADGNNKRPEGITLTLKRTTESTIEIGSWEEVSYTVKTNSIIDTVQRAASAVVDFFTGSSASSGPELTWTKGDNQWTYTFSNLDGYDPSGKHYIYKVEEKSVPDGYRGEVLTDSDGSGLPDLVNIRQTELSIEKKWYKSDDVTPESVIIKVYRTTDSEIPANVVSDGTGDSEYLGSVTLYDGNNWQWSGSSFDSTSLNVIPATNGTTYFDSYKIYDSNGKPMDKPQKYLYYAREYQATTNDSTYSTGGIVTTEPSDGFILVGSENFQITENATSNLTATPGQLDSSTAVIINRQTTKLSLTKTWLDDGNAYKTRPDELTIKLSRSVEGGEKEEITDAEATTVKGRDNKWTFTWKNMPMYDMDGNLYTYYAEEVVPDAEKDSLLPGSSYICLENNNTVSFDESGKAVLTNLLKKKTDLAGQKTWSDGDASIRPDRIDLTLYRRLSGDSDWEKIEDTEPTWYKQSDGTWNFIYSNILQTDEKGARYYYKVEENVPAGYRVYYSKDDDGNELILKNVADGSLTISKEVTGSGGNKQKEFHFTIEVGTLPDGSKLPDGTYGEITFTDSKAEITLKSGESKTATGLPGDITYVVKETEANTGGYKTSSENDEGTIAPNTLQSVLFINNRVGTSSGGGSKGSGGSEKNPNGNIPTGPAKPAEPTTPVEPEPDNSKGHESPTLEDDPGRVARANRDKLKNGEYGEGNVDGKSRVAKTGDSADIARDLIEIFAAGAGILFLLFFRRKKKKEE